MKLLFPVSSSMEFGPPKLNLGEPERWIRFLTVLGYIFFVSLPALSFSVYYIYMWDPGYMNKYISSKLQNYFVLAYNIIITLFAMSYNISQNDSIGYPVKYLETIKSDRAHRDIAAADVITTISTEPATVGEMDLARILREGTKSMESSSASQEILVNPS